MSMSVDSIEIISKQFNDSAHTEDDIKKSIIAFDKLEEHIVSFSDYIILKYNKCLLYDLSSDTTRDQFFAELEDLNDAILSGIMDDSDVAEELFYNVGNLNFKVHKYDIAETMLEKSKRRERIKTNSINVDMRFHKRCLSAFCSEYMAKSLMDYIRLVQSLVGYKIGQNDIRESIIENIIKLYYDSIDDKKCFISETINSLYDGNNECIYYWVKQNYSDQVITENQYNDQIKDIAHILAHCLSEYNKIAEEKQITNNTEYVYLVRVSQLLMKALGIEFVTCFSTLKMEQNEYYSALEILNEAKKELKDQIWGIQHDVKELDSEYRTVNEQIAQIDFYIWYFSVFAQKKDGIESKKSFRKYCETSQDSTAISYYEILHMKEVLIGFFSDYKKGIVNQKDIDEFNSFYESIREKSHHHTLPDVLVKEWESLKFSYSVYLRCKDIYNSTDNDNKTYTHYSLYKTLYDKYNIAYTEQLIRTQKDSLPIFKINLFNGSFLYLGKRENLKSTLKKLNIGIKPSHNLGYKKIMRKIMDSPQLKDTSNILIIPDDEKYDIYLSLISFIISDETKSFIEEHNIYIDTSVLSESSRESFEKSINELNESRCLYIIRNSKVACSQCVMFAFLEYLLSILHKPLDSFVISPVSGDYTYKSQSFRSDKLIYSIDSKIGFLPEWDNNFGSCYSVNRRININGKKLDIDYIRKIPDYNRIKYLFLFEYSFHSDGTRIYAFDIAGHCALGSEYIISDGIHPCDNKNDIFKAIETFYKGLKYSQNHKRVGHDNCTENCDSAFVKIDLNNDKQQKKFGKYRVLREYLYSYLGIMVDKSTFILLQCNESARQEKTKRYVLVSFTKAVDPSEQQPYCYKLRQLSKYIDDAVSSDSLSKIETVADLEKQIKPCDSSQKYFFISYRSKQGLAKLCEPVYRDVLYVQKKYSQKFSCYIDVASSSIQFAKDIEERINSSDCIGAFIYLSPYYFDSETCLKELELINGRKAEDKSFIVLPIFLKSNCSDTDYKDTSDADAFVRKMAEKLRNDLSNGERTKFDLFTEALQIDDSNTSKVALETWKPFGEHIGENRNFRCELKKYYNYEE